MTLDYHMCASERQSRVAFHPRFTFFFLNLKVAHPATEIYCSEQAASLCTSKTFLSNEVSYGLIGE